MELPPRWAGREPENDLFHWPQYNPARLQFSRTIGVPRAQNYKNIRAPTDAVFQRRNHDPVPSKTRPNLVAKLFPSNILNKN
jgi:hypothetical protein